MTCDIDITLTTDLHVAASIRQVLFDEQKLYTYDPTCIPERIVKIREFIRQIDEQIEANLPKENNEGV
tara:strand:- start:835 stop:1038 length:204 start_codon:yes stop_codon:yes gene_type:complete